MDKCLECPPPTYRAQLLNAPVPRSANVGRPPLNPQSFDQKFRNSGRYQPYEKRCPVPGPAAGQNVVAPAAAAEDNSDLEWELSEDYKNGWPRDFKRTGPRYPGSADHVSTDRVRTVP